MMIISAFSSRRLRWPMPVRRLAACRPRLSVACSLRPVPLVVPVLLLLASGVSVAQAGKVAAWRHTKPADFQKGAADGVVIDAEGNLRLSRDVREVADLHCSSVFDLAPASNGRMLAATAVPGKVVEIDPDGTTRTLWESEEDQAFALLALPDGAALVGTGPHGKIYRLDAEGEATDFFQVDGEYVWDLVADAQGNVYAATGPKGTIYRIAADGKGTVFYATQQSHVLCLAMAPDGGLLAGTDGQGLVLHVSPQGEARVLYDAAESEVHAVRADPRGVVYAATAAGGRTSTAPSATKPATASKPGDNRVYRIAPDGSARELLKVKARIYDLEPLRSNDAQPNSPPEWLACTGPEGLLYAFSPDEGQAYQNARFDTETLLTARRDRDGRLWIATGSPGKVYALSAGYRTSGTLTSAPLDAKLTATFGRLTWRGHAPQGTQIAIAVRSGNTKKPDQTWSAWSVEKTDPHAALAECPKARFLQYRITLSTIDARTTPLVRSVAVSYLTTNQAPHITKFTVPHVEEGDGKKIQNELKIDWDASDPNSDGLRYRLRFQKDGWQDWVLLKNDLKDDHFTWDITSVPEGVYRLEVVASDRPSNPAETALQARRVSEPFVVDRQPPQVQARLVGLKQGGSATIEVSLDDTMSPIVRASYSLDSQPWVTVFPNDGLFDSPHEALRFTVALPRGGTHVVVVRATDAAGRTGAADLVFESGAAAAPVDAPSR